MDNRIAPSEILRVIKKKCPVNATRQATYNLSYQVAWLVVDRGHVVIVMDAETQLPSGKTYIDRILKTYISLIKITTLSSTHNPALKRSLPISR